MPHTPEAKPLSNSPKKVIIWILVGVVVLVLLCMRSKDREALALWMRSWIHTGSKDFVKVGRGEVKQFALDVDKSTPWFDSQGRSVRVDVSPSGNGFILIPFGSKRIPVPPGIEDHKSYVEYLKGNFQLQGTVPGQVATVTVGTR